ncbi:uncharacterized protein [Diadema setosum]|uniref:uncharacterized protein n=1 Tax=Diadema setosum TaxID=31175 RepID=UPI003B3B5289
MLMPLKMPPKYRRKTYTKIEKQILMELIEPNLPAITDKRKEGKVLFNCDRAWTEITLLFNAHRDTVSRRSSDDLRGAWKYVTQVQFPKLPPMQIVMEYLNGRKRLVNYRALLLDASHWKMEDGAEIPCPPLTDLPNVKQRGKRTVYKLYEKELLLELVTNRWSDVMLTGPELTCELRRDGAWQEIHDNYNEDPRAVTQRTIRDLRYCWKYMVQQGRQVEAKLKAQQPGDPPFIPTPTEAVYLRVRQLELDCGSRFLPFFLQSPQQQGDDMSPHNTETPSPQQGQPLQVPQQGTGRRGRPRSTQRQEAAESSSLQHQSNEAQQQQQQHQVAVSQHQGNATQHQAPPQQHQAAAQQHQGLTLQHQSQAPQQAPGQHQQPGMHHGSAHQGSSPHQVQVPHQGQSPHQAPGHPGPGPLQVPAHLSLIPGLTLHQAPRPQHTGS